MRIAASLSVVVILLTVPAFGVINILLTADKTTISVGETTTVRMWAQGTQAGIFGAAGSTVATGDPGTLTTMAVVGPPNVNGWCLDFAVRWGPKAGTPGANGGRDLFGSQMADFLVPDPTFGRDQYVDLFDYTVAGAGNGLVTLTVVPGYVAGYKFIETDKSTTIGTITPVTIQVAPTLHLSVTPSTDLAVTGWQGGPFEVNSVTYTLANASSSESLPWTAAGTQAWVSVSKTSGTLAPGGTDTVVVSLNTAANDLPVGAYSDTVTFTNTANGNGNTTRSVSLSIPDPTGDFNGDGHVDVVDLLIFVAAWGTRPADASWNAACDLNDDRYVDDTDKQVFLLAYGAHPGDANWNAACDFNGNGAVDSGDYSIFQGAYGSYGGDSNYDPACDLNSDGWVDVVDLLTFEEYFGI